MFAVKNVNVQTKSFKKTPILDKYVNLMKTTGISDAGYNMLPQNSWDEIKFELHNTNVGFANGLRRTLLSDIPVYSLVADEKDIITDDEFILGMNDVLVKNIGLLPIYQPTPLLNADDTCDYDIYLYVYNNTDDIIDIKASDISVVPRSGKRSNMPKLTKQQAQDLAAKKAIADNVANELTKKANAKKEESDKSTKTITKKKKGGADVEDAAADTNSPDVSNDTNADVTVEDVTDNSDVESDVEAESNTDTSNLENKEDSLKLTNDKLTNDNPINDKSINDKSINDKPLKRNSELTTKLMPELNITIMRLRPGKYLKIQQITFIKGKASYDAGRFSLLNNVSYKPMDIEPYNQFTKKGTRSSTVDCKQFAFDLTTCGNITPKNLIYSATDAIRQDLLDVKQKITLYSKAEHTTFYSGESCTVTIVDDLYTYKLLGHYYTIVNMIAMACYELDPNILHCISAVERYDTLVGIIRLKHPEPNKLILSAIDVCLKNLQTIEASF